MQAATIDADGSQDVAAAVGDFGETMERWAPSQCAVFCTDIGPEAS